jgi:hypothetical protein
MGNNKCNFCGRPLVLPSWKYCDNQDCGRKRGYKRYKEREERKKLANQTS